MLPGLELAAARDDEPVVADQARLRLARAVAVDRDPHLGDAGVASLRRDSLTSPAIRVRPSPVASTVRANSGSKPDSSSGIVDPASSSDRHDAAGRRARRLVLVGSASGDGGRGRARERGQRQ